MAWSDTASGWMSWFVGYRGGIAIAAMEFGKTPQLSAAALARAFFSRRPLTLPRVLLRRPLTLRAFFCAVR